MIVLARYTSKINKLPRLLRITLLVALEWRKYGTLTFNTKQLVVFLLPHKAGTVDTLLVLLWNT